MPKKRLALSEGCAASAGSSLLAVSDGATDSPPSKKARRGEDAADEGALVPQSTPEADVSRLMSLLSSQGVLPPASAPQVGLEKAALSLRVPRELAAQALASLLAQGSKIDVAALAGALPALLAPAPPGAEPSDEEKNEDIDEENFVPSGGQSFD